MSYWYQLTSSASAEMTLPSVVRDLLMFAPSLRRAPLAPVLSALSLPARSTRLILLTYVPRHSPTLHFTNGQGNQSINQLKLQAAAACTVILSRVNTHTDFIKQTCS